MGREGVDAHIREQRQAFSEPWSREHPQPVATVADLADHGEHEREIGAVKPELLARGWSDDECAAVVGVNVLRVLREAESVAGGAATVRA